MNREGTLGAIDDLAQQIGKQGAEILRLQAENKRLLGVVRAVREKAIRDFYTGTGSDSDRWVSCLLCTWMWHYGEAELHDKECPLRKEKA